MAASKEDLTEQLSLTTKIAASIERMSAAADKLEQSYTAQVDAVQKLANVLGQLNVQGAVQGFEVLNKAVTEMKSKMQDTGHATEATMQKLGKSVEKAGKTFVDKFPKSVAVGTAALSGFYQGIKNVVALTKSVTGFFGTFVDGLVNVAASIIAIPFKIFSGLVDMAAKSGGGANELAQAIEELRKQFGALYGPSNKAIIDTAKSLKGFSDTGLSAWRVFGNMADRLKYIGELAKEMGGAFGKLRGEMEDNGGAILAYQKGLGILAEDMKGVVTRSVSMGKKTSDSLKDMTKYSYELGDAFGVDAKLISRDMSKALMDVKHFGGATVKQIAEASTYARKLGFELKDITGTLDAFDTFDTAAENAAKLSQAFGVQVDAFEMMKAQSPAEQIDMLRKSFARAGVDAGNFNRAQLKLVASTTGLDESVVQSALSLKNQGVGLDQIKKKGAEAEKKTLTQAEAMGKLADAIERMVQSGGGMEGGFWDMFVKGITRGIMSTKEFVGLMWKIKRALMQVYFEGVKLGKELVDIVPGFKEIGTALNQLFDPAHITGVFKGIRVAIEKFFGRGDDPTKPEKGSIPGLVSNLSETFKHFLTLEGPGAQRMLEGIKKFFTMLSKLATDGITWLSGEIKKGIEYVVDLLTGKKKLDLGGAAAEGKGALGFLAGLIKPIGEALREAWKELKGPLHDLVMELGHKLMHFLKSKEFINLIKPALPVLAVALFGPAFSRGIIGALSTSLLKGVFSGGASKVIKKAVSSLAGEGGIGQLGGIAGKVAGPAALVAAAASIGEGVNKYTDGITSTLDHSAKVIGAGTTGIVDALTLGLLPDDFGKQIADVLAKGTDELFKAVKKFFGKGFGDSLERYLGSTFEVFGNIWGFVKNLFSGDQASFEQSAKELGMSLVRFAVTAIEYLFIQLPTWIARMAARVIGMLVNAISKLVGLGLGVVAEGIDKVFGTDLSSKVKQASDMISAGIEKASDTVVDQLSKSSDQIHGWSSKLQDEYLRTDADKAKLAKQATASVNDQLDAVTTDMIDKDKLNDLDLSSKNFEHAADSVKSIADSTKDMNDQLRDYQKQMTDMSDIIKGNAKDKSGVTGALMAVSEMVKQANELDKALGDGNINKINVKAKLDRVAQAVGLGGKVSYTVNPSKQVQIQLNLEVTMDVDRVEKVMILRQSSIVRDRLDFATGKPTAQGNTLLSSYTPENPPPPIIETST